MKHKSLKSRNNMKETDKSILLSAIPHAEAFLELNRYFSMEENLGNGYSRLILVIYLYEYNEVDITAKGICQYTGLSMASTGVMLGKLVHHKLIVSDKTENRINYYKLSGEGKALVLRYAEAFNNTNNFLAKVMNDIFEARTKVFIKKRAELIASNRKKRLIDHLKNM